MTLWQISSEISHARNDENLRRDLPCIVRTILPMVFAPAKQGFHTHADYSARNDENLRRDLQCIVRTILPMVFAPAKQGFHTHADYSARNDENLRRDLQCIVGAILRPDYSARNDEKPQDCRYLQYVRYCCHGASGSLSHTRLSPGQPPQNVRCRPSP